MTIADSDIADSEISSFTTTSSITTSEESDDSESRSPDHHFQAADSEIHFPVFRKKDPAS